MSDQYKTKTFIYPNMIVRVHYPVLTDEEKQQRQKKIYKAAEDLLKELVRYETKR